MADRSAGICGTTCRTGAIVAPMPPYVIDLQFDGANRPEIEAHGITEDEVESVLTTDPRFVVKKRGRAGAYLMIGPSLGGKMLTVPITPTGSPGLWRPVTAWPSSRGELTRWQRGG